MTTNRTADEANQPFSKALFENLVGALTDASGSPWMIAEVLDTGLTPDGSEPVRMKLTLDGSLRGEVLLECHRPAAAMLASKFLRQQVEEFGTEQSEALLRLIEAGMSRLRAGLEQEYGRFTITVSSTSEPASDSADVSQITIADDEANRASILMCVNPLLTEALSLRSKDHRKAAGTDTSMQGTVTKAMPMQTNLDMVMDVELNVTLRFGQRQLTLREMLELTIGSVVELDRQVEEPVELLLEGKVIARGEAVVIDGNYGLRVTEVSQPFFSPAIH
jgi:flagellar motor switch protein FliN/FliY